MDRSHFDLPKEFLSSLDGLAGFDSKGFALTHASASPPTSIRINPGKLQVLPSELGSQAEKIPWSTHGYYLSERPSFTFDPLFHAGAYYVQEASGMFLEEVLRQTVDLSQPQRVLDLCAAPGGKSTLIQSLITKDSLLVSNELIRGRVGVLQGNMVKWGAANVIVTQNDARDFGKMENYFDVIVVDAPCSGSGLFRRDPAAIKEWSVDSVQACSQRQRRILADCWPALHQGGVLIYSTCSYSKEEDEDILDWLIDATAADPATATIGEAAESLRLSIDDHWNIVETITAKRGYGYRFYPDRLKGEGFFIAAVKKMDGGEFIYPRTRTTIGETLTKQEESAIRNWVRPERPLRFFSHNEQLFSLPAELAADAAFLQSCAYLKCAGISTGRVAAKEFIPAHELALSELIPDALPAIDLSKEEAIQYLRKEEIRLPAAGAGTASTPDAASYRGWALVRYEGLNLGWIKILPGRINNYYPREWRILKRS
jgi:16S rRNA C967 or C1407 C5-methylase (RsmB/RsmF family)/NOL1/NOP2/fmu family ribosome biogenesis protein